MELTKNSTHRTATPLGTIRTAQRGDRQAFGQLVEQYQDAVYATAWRKLGNHAEAQELCQDVFCHAMRKIGDLRDPRCFGGWLRSITQRMAINRLLRRRPLGVGTADNLADTCVEYRTPLSQMLAGERAAQVRLGLKRLCALDRDTLMAFYFDGRSLVEMSRQFSAPLGTVKRRLHTARKRLAKELQRAEA
jgi:RNA polymerase sigma-70 factor, ECF subfamily